MFNWPGVANAIGLSYSMDFGSVLNRLEQDSNVRCVVLTQRASCAKWQI